MIVSMDITAAILLQTALTKGRHHRLHIMCLRWHQPADDDAAAEMETPRLRIWPLAGGNCSRTVTAWRFQTSSKCPSAAALTSVVTSFESHWAIKAPPECPRRSGENNKNNKSCVTTVGIILHVPADKYPPLFLPSTRREIK